MKRRENASAGEVEGAGENQPCATAVGAGGAPTSAAVAPFQEACCAYVKKLGEVGEQANSAFRTAYQDLVQQLNDLQKQGEASRLSEVCRSYLQTVQDTALPSTEGVRAAWSQFLVASQSAFGRLDSSTTAADLAAVASLLSAAASLAAGNEGSWRVAGMWNADPACVVVTR